MKHKIMIRSEKRGMNQHYSGIRKTAKATLEMEGVLFPCQIGFILTDDEGIRRVNRETRGMDKPTDVLSFPMLELAPGEPYAPLEQDLDPDTGLVYLGDVLISIERVREQAKQYGHSLEIELSYLTVHSVLHLLGYDHMDEGPDKKLMRRHEEAVMDMIRGGVHE